MHELDHLFQRNRAWAADIEAKQPGFFSTLLHQQSPEYLWIGCSDSRVPANEIVGMLPGELFVHRNVANLVVHTDINCLSVLQYAIDALHIKHIMVVGHYGCGGVRAAIEDVNHGLIDNWLRHIQEIRRGKAAELSELGPHALLDRMCELNVVRQALNVGQTTVVQDAWRRGQAVTVHGWIYGVGDGLLQDLGVGFSNADELAMAEDRYRGV